MIDQTTLNQWYPVARTDAVGMGGHLGVEILGERLVLWRHSGGLSAFKDQCPHRGAQFSINTHTEEGRLRCPYHGWAFDASGECVEMPSQPGGQPVGNTCLDTYKTVERYGIIWATIGDNPSAAPSFPGIDDRFRLALTDVFRVETSGPRVVENFLDISHFGFVHDGYFGRYDDPTPAPDYNLEFDETGVCVSELIAVQEKASASATGAAPIHYTYQVNHSMMASLSKTSGEGASFPDDIIVIAVQPLAEDVSLVWTILARSYDTDKDDQSFIDFQHTIFMQDKGVLESQRPKRLPIDLKMEAHQNCDRVSIAYRRWLQSKEVSYGTVS